jgi:hypothetical protein
VYKTIPLAALLPLGLALAARSAAPPSEPKPWLPAVERLVAQLGDADYRTREEAERRLHGYGLKAIPVLRKALGRPSSEARRRALRLISTLESAALLAPRRVTLEVKNKTLTAIFAEITRQTGYKIAYSSSVGGPEGTFSFAFRNLTFWEAVDRICRAGGLVVQAGYGDDTVRLYRQGGHSRFTGRAGAFRFVANNFTMNRHVDFGLAGPRASPPARSEQLTLSLTVFAEPKLPIVKVGEPRLDAAYDSEKNSMLIVHDPRHEAMVGRRWTRSYYYGGGKQLSVQTAVQLARPSVKATSVKVMRGVIPVTLLVEQKPLVVTDKLMSARGKKFTVADAEFTFSDVKKLANGQYQVQVTVTNRNKAEAGDYSWPGNLYQRIEVQDDKGTRYHPWSTSWGSMGPGNFQLTMTFGVFGAPAAAAKARPPSKFIYHYWQTRDHFVAFTFRDLPLP